MQQKEARRLLVSPKGAAELLTVSPRKMWSMTFEETPGVPFVRVGRLVRYSVTDLEAWIAAHKEGGE